MAMGTRFLMTSDSGVPAATLQRYLTTRDPERIRISTLVDGMPQRMIPNEVLERLEQAAPLRRTLIALRTALQWKAHTGMSLRHAAAVLLRALREDPSTLAQTVMAGNAPLLLQRAMVEGRPEQGVMSAGQVAALIGQLNSCRHVIDGIVAQAVERRAVLLQGMPA
jgi:nitronate monooxygenase